jgi:hypothetical protein
LDHGQAFNGLIKDPSQKEVKYLMKSYLQSMRLLAVNPFVKQPLTICRFYRRQIMSLTNLTKHNPRKLVFAALKAVGAPAKMLGKVDAVVKNMRAVLAQVKKCRTAFGFRQILLP